MPEGKVRVLRGPADARALKERDTAKPPCELPDALGRQARVDAPKIRKRTCQRSIRPKLSGRGKLATVGWHFASVKDSWLRKAAKLRAEGRDRPDCNVQRLDGSRVAPARGFYVATDRPLEIHPPAWPFPPARLRSSYGLPYGHAEKTARISLA